MASLKAEIALEWADGEYLFALKGAQIEELQAQCGNVGFGAIHLRVLTGVWFWGDLYHTVRLGLMGGGMGAVEAKRLTDRYIGQETDSETRVPLGKGPNSPLSVARAVMNAAMFGIEEAIKDAPPAEDDQSGEAQAGESPAFTQSQDTAPPSLEMG